MKQLSKVPLSLGLFCLLYTAGCEPNKDEKSISYLQEQGLSKAEAEKVHAECKEISKTSGVPVEDLEKAAMQLRKAGGFK